jgi:ABC-type nitrate/sulfonate/bicarbonate transport system ATPase subunit
MDEPFGALDDITRPGARLLRIRESTAATVLFVTRSIRRRSSDASPMMDGAPGRIRRVLDIDLPHPRPAGPGNTPLTTRRARALRC